MTPTAHDYVVDGMTCEHCQAKVTAKVSEVPGVRDIQVDLPAGRLTVVGEADDEAVRAAIVEAGYGVAE